MKIRFLVSAIACSLGLLFSTARVHAGPIIVGNLDRPRTEPKRPLDVAVDAYWMARRHRFTRDLHSLPDHVEAILLPTGAPPKLPFNDFSRSDELMANAYRASTDALDERMARRQ